MGFELSRLYKAMCGVAIAAGAVVFQEALAQTPLKAETLASLPGKNPEGIAYGADGAIYFSSADSMEVLRYKDGAASVFAKMPIHTLVVVAAANGFVVDGHKDVPDRSQPGALNGAGRLVAFDKAGAVTKVVNVGSLPNGLVRLKGDVYLAGDSNEGKIWRVDMAKGEASVWLANENLAVKPGGRGPGVNGLKLRGDTLYFANTSVGAIYTVKVGKDGAPGAVAKLGDAPSADDFDVAKDGTVYVATHGPIVKITPSGETSHLTEAKDVDGGPALMLSSDQRSLYVLTSGRPKPLPADAPAGARPEREPAQLVRVWLPPKS